MMMGNGITSSRPPRRASPVDDRAQGGVLATKSAQSMRCAATEGRRDLKCTNRLRHREVMGISGRISLLRQSMSAWAQPRLSSSCERTRLGISPNDASAFSRMKRSPHSNAASVPIYTSACPESRTYSIPASEKVRQKSSLAADRVMPRRPPQEPGRRHRRSSRRSHQSPRQSAPQSIRVSEGI